MSENPRIEELRRRVQTDPASIAFAALAEEYRRAGRFEEAVATCEAGLLRHPAYLSARVTLGRSLQELARYNEARAQLEQVLRAAPENLAAIRALAEIHGHGGAPSSDHAADSIAGPIPGPAAGMVPSHAPAPLDLLPPAPAAEPFPQSVSAPEPAVIQPAPSPIRLAVPRVDPPNLTPPALAELEIFLAAILRARDELHPGDAIR